MVTSLILWAYSLGYNAYFSIEIILDGLHDRNTPYLSAYICILVIVLSLYILAVFSYIFVWRYIVHIRSKVINHPLTNVLNEIQRRNSKFYKQWPTAVILWLSLNWNHRCCLNATDWSKQKFKQFMTRQTKYWQTLTLQSDYSNTQICCGVFYCDANVKVFSVSSNTFTYPHIHAFHISVSISNWDIRPDVTSILFTGSYIQTRWRVTCLEGDTFHFIKWNRARIIYLANTFY